MLDDATAAATGLAVGSTVFCGMSNFEPSHELSTFSRNFAEMVLMGEKGTNAAYFDRIQAAVAN